MVYGVLGLKTHCKLALIVRRERDGIRRYVHLGTGNYNATTARIYTDLGLLTCREDIASDVSDIFNFLTGFSNPKSYRKLGVAPVSLRDTIHDMIRNEIKYGKDGLLIFKVNSLLDPAMIEDLYRASQAGVRELDRARHLLHSARPARRQREYPRHQHRRPLSGAQPHLLRATTATN